MTSFRPAIVLLLLSSSCLEDLPSKETSAMAGNDVEHIQPQSEPTGWHQQTDLNDTTFLYREVTGDFYHAIYIEKDRTARFYQWLMDFSFNESSERGYTDMLHTLVDVPKPLVKPSALALPKHWVPLFKYNSDYYLYSPSDRGNEGKRILNDSTFVYWYMDGPYPLPLLDVKRLSDYRYSFRMINPHDHMEKPANVTIHIVDPRTNTAIFEFSNEPAQYRYQLLVPADSAHHFDMIVNYCENQKQLEFEFDTIDHASLLVRH